MRIVRGNPRQHALPANEPKPRPITPRCPMNVIQNKGARAAWRQLVKLSKSMRVLAEADGPLLEKLALSWARLREIEAHLQEKGLGVFIQVYESKTGAKIGQPSAFYAIYRAELDFFFRALQQMGFTPAARTRIQTVGGQSATNPFLELG